MRHRTVHPNGGKPDLDGAGSILSTVGGPGDAAPPASLGATTRESARLLEKVTSDAALAAAMPFNPGKPLEYGDNASTPHAGATRTPSTPLATASTTTENIVSPKVGDGTPDIGRNPLKGPLDRVRVDSSGRVLTTNQGVKVADNQHSLKIGLRGPTALEDFILREKITHFDHERIPESVVHARGSGAHGYFESYGDYSALTRAAPFAAKGKKTPVFMRFSTVAGSRGSADTVRDVRGFATKFYTDQGVWDLVGNNIPVFFIQDAMKFPDLIHSVKPEPHNEIPQAASAHDTFWDFAGLSPEIFHMLLWHTSDRAIPRSYRTMQGFGVHTFRLVNAQGETRLCKFHWTPLQGTHSLVWDEAVKLAGADADFHRRDIDFSNDPLLQGRIHSYIDTQITRLGGPNFHEIPINGPVVGVHNNQRDGMHRQAINRGRVAYEPNSLAGGFPKQAGEEGFVSYPEPVEGSKLRGKAALFAEHYGQARLFWQSQSPAEQRHIINAFGFELTRVQTPAIRERIVAGLVNVDAVLAASVAAQLGIAVPPALPRASEAAVPSYPPSPSLSLLRRPGHTGVRTRRVALLVADDVDAGSARAVYGELLHKGAQPRMVGAKLGKVAAAAGGLAAAHEPIDVEITVQTGPSVVYDAVVLLGGTSLPKDPRVLDFVRDQYRHGKPILALGVGQQLADAAGLPRLLPDGSADPGLIVAASGNLPAALAAFEAALSHHRVYARETDPPRV